MAYNENINLFVTTDRNNADVFNAPLEKIIQNIQDTREYLHQLQTELDQLESKVISEYTPTEQLNDLLAKGIKGDKGDKGDTGESLEYNWDGTALGVKLESESEFTYRELKGEPGDVNRTEISSGVDLNSLTDINKEYITTNNTIARQCTNIPKSGISSFELRVYKTTYSQDSKYLIQILKTFTNELWIRGRDGYLDTWTEWKQMATNDDIETINNNIDNVKTDLETKLGKKMNVICSYLNNQSGDLLDTTISPLVLCALSATNNASLHAILNDSFAYVMTYFYHTMSETSNRFQVAVGYAKDKMAVRRYKDGWGNWTELLTASDVHDWAKAPTKPTYTASEVGALASDGTAVKASQVANALTLQIGGATKTTFNGSAALSFNVPNASTSTAGVMSSAMVTKLNGIATGANLIKTSKNTAKFSSQSAFSPAISSCIIGNNTVGGVWVFTGYITYNVSSAPSANASILSINQQMTQFEDVTIICPCMTANNAYITLKVSGGTLYYQSYTGSAPTSGSRYFVSAVIPVSSTSFLNA